MKSSRMAFIESEQKCNGEDFDMDEDDFEVVDCWEDEGGEEEIPISQMDVAQVSETQQKTVIFEKSSDECFNSKTMKNRKHNSIKNSLMDDVHTNVSQVSKEVKDGSDSSRDNGDSKKVVILSSKISNNGKTIVKESCSSPCSKKGSSKPNQIKRNDNQNTSPKSHSRNIKRIDSSSASTEKKVDNFLKEMALQHPKVNNLDGTKHIMDPLVSPCKPSGKILSNESKKKPMIDPSDLPPGVDLDQVAEDTSTLGLLAASETKTDCNLKSTNWGRSNNASSSSSLPKKVSVLPDVLEPDEGSVVKSCRIDGRLYADYSKIIPQDKSNWSKSPHRFQKSGLSAFHSSKHVSKQQRLCSAGDRYSSSPSRHSKSPSLSLSPSPPRFHHWSGTLVRDHLSSSEISLMNRPSKFIQYTRQQNYRSPSSERNYYKRSRDSSVLRALSRSLSRERLHRHSRSRSKSCDRKRSRSGRRLSHTFDEKRRKCSQSRSRSRTPRARSHNSITSTSSSPKHCQYRRGRSPSIEEDRSKKKPHLIAHAALSRPRSPWKPHLEADMNKWYDPFVNQNGCVSALDDGKLEHDMERFIATNMAATGQLRQPVADWLEISNEKDVKPLSDSSFELIDQPMPLPPPPPDISELMKSDERLEDGQVMQDQNVSLSRLLESAVSGVPSQVVIDRCQDAIMKLHDVGIKQGRLNIIPSIFEPEHTSAQFPWQSILHRSIYDKIYFSLTKLPENPVPWKTLESSRIVSEDISKASVRTVELVNAPNPNHSMGDSFAASNSFEHERTTLLEKIAFLTKELHEVKQILDSSQVLKISVAVQTEQYLTSCLNCEKFKDIRLNTPQKPLSRSLLNPPSLLSPSSLSSTSQSSSSVTLLCPPHEAYSSMTESSIPCSTYSLTPASSFACPPISNSSCRLSVFPPAVPQPVPAPSVNVPRLTLHPKPSSDSSFIHVPTTTSTFHGSSNGSKQTWSQMVTQPALPGVLCTSGSQAKLPCDQQNANANIEWRNGTSTNKSVAVVPKKNLQIVGGPVDYQIINHQMVGDEYMFDLVAYLSSTGPTISVDPKYCSYGLTVDKLLALFSSRNSVVKHQIIVMVGVYNMFNSCWESYLKKYTHLVGFLRRRCSHLILIEPPPIPRLVNSSPYWASVEALAKLLKSYKTENVSVVFTHQLLMHAPRTPNPTMYSCDKRLNESGLQVIAQELVHVLNLAKTAKKGLLA